MSLEESNSVLTSYEELQSKHRYTDALYKVLSEYAPKLEMKTKLILYFDSVLPSDYSVEHTIP